MKRLSKTPAPQPSKTPAASPPPAGLNFRITAQAEPDQPAVVALDIRQGGVVLPLIPLTPDDADKVADLMKASAAKARAINAAEKS